MFADSLIKCHDIYMYKYEFWVYLIYFYCT